MRAPIIVPLVTALLLGGPSRPAGAARLKELVEVEGFRENALYGLGLVVGLAGTGDDPSSFLVRRPMAELLKHLGNVVDVNDIKAKNVAVVAVTAALPPFAQPGVKLDVTVSSMGTAKSLSGGTLLATPLKGADYQVYALAQGSVVVGGFSVSGGSGSSSSKNHVTVARIPGGAVTERRAPAELPREQVVLLLREPDFTTAQRIAEAIDATLGPGRAVMRDPASVVVAVDAGKKENVVRLVAQLEAIDAVPDTRGRVVLDERTGMVVVGANVELGPVAIAHGGLSVQIAERKEVSQPQALAAGTTTVTPATEIAVDEKEGLMHLMPQSGTVGDVAAALNALGVKPRDLVSIFQALKAAGALRADLQVM